MSDFIISVGVQGLLYGILSMGVMISYRILDIPDLSVDGTFPLGVAVSAILIVNGVNPWIALLASLIAGLIAGSITGLLHVKLGISSLLSGILVMTGLYSINLMVAGSSNVPLFAYNTLFVTKNLSGLNLPDFVLKYYQIIVLFILTMIVKVIIDLLLKTRFGYLLKVTGDNEGLVTTLGHDVGTVKIFGLAIANGIVAFSGGIAASVGRTFDISLGTGMVVLGLSSVILGTTLFGKLKIKQTTMVILGSIVYRLIIAIALELNMNPQHLNLATVIIFVVAIVLNKSKVAKKIGMGEIL